MVPDFKIRMLGETDAQVKVACCSAARARFSAASHAESLAFGHTRRDFYLVSLGPGDLARAAANVANVLRAPLRAAAVLTRHAMPHGNRSHRPAQRFLQRDHDIAFNDPPALAFIAPGDNHDLIVLFDFDSNCHTLPFQIADCGRAFSIRLLHTAIRSLPVRD